MLSDAIMMWVLIMIMASPFIYLCLGKRRFAMINAVLCVLYVFIWYNSSKYKGSLTLNMETIIWLTLLLTLILFLGVAISLVMMQWFALKKSTLIVVAFLVLVLGVMLTSFINDGAFKLLEVTLIVVVPMYVFSLLLIGVIKFDKEHRTVERLLKHPNQVE
ncbi:hypothetical protein [Alkalihalobacillus sp. 1P02AB]|uniref:hypothetical protein n=1 Tax=Alkalihalobacillus sp. 1P02AB TaxID=3132260 RepID=UPI0039A5412E